MKGVRNMSNTIYLEAERLRKKYNTRDPFEFLEAINVRVDFTHEFPKNGLKGFCTIFNHTRYVVINAFLCEEEQRVVAGHEAGHIILHMDDLKVGAFRDNDIYMAKSRKEREANFFAADFLISDDDVLDAMKACDANFFTVAHALCIPEPFFAFKLYSMVERGYTMKMPIDLDSTFLAK